MSILAPRDSRLVKKSPQEVFNNYFDDLRVDTMTIDTITANAIDASSISFGPTQSDLSYYKAVTGLSLTMTDGTNNYVQNLAVERIGNVVNLTLRAVTSPIAAVNIVNSTAGVLSEYRPANSSTQVFYATYPSGSALPALRLTITSGGVLQIRKLDGTAFSGVGTLAYDEFTISYSAV